MAAKDYGRYALLRKLATGGMAEVFLARQKGPQAPDRLLVVKRILPHLAEDLDFVTMFLNEARIAVRFNHPNIVQILDLGMEEDSYFIAMEHIHGEDLGHLARRAAKLGVPLPLEMCLFVASEVCGALHYAHGARDERGQPLEVVHRDVSPQNVLVGFDGVVKVLDFGVARAADQTSTTRVGTVKGRAAYMAPEVVCGLPFDHRVDQFATGLVLYELLTGVRPLKRDHEMASLRAALECEIEPPSKVAPGVPADLDPVLMRAMARVPDDRYPDSDAFRRALEAYLASHGARPTSAKLSGLMHELFADRLERERAAEEGALGIPGDWPLVSGPGDATGVLPPDAPSARQRAQPWDFDWEAPPALVPPRAPDDSRIGAEPPEEATAGDAVSPVFPEPARRSAARSRARAGPSSIAEPEPHRASDGGAAPDPMLAPAPSPPRGLDAQAPAGPRAEPSPERAPAVELCSDPIGPGERPSPDPESGPSSIVGTPKANASAALGERLARIVSPTRLVLAVLAFAIAAILLAPGTLSLSRSLLMKASAFSEAQGARLTLESNVPVEVYLAEEYLGMTPLLEREVPPGALALRLVNQSLGIERKLALGARPGESVRRRERFALGRVLFQSDPECDVYLRGQRVARAPGPALDYAEGTYEAECRNEPLGLSGRARLSVAGDPSRPVEVRFQLAPMVAPP